MREAGAPRALTNSQPQSQATPIARCACPESEHLRAALNDILTLVRDDDVDVIQLAFDVEMIAAAAFALTELPPTE